MAEKQAWAVEALSNAQVVFVDRESTYTPPTGAVRVTTDDDDEYTGTNNDDNRSHDTGPGDTYDPNNTATVTLEGGSYYGFFIIPNNTLANFLNDWNDNGVFNTFSLNGSSTNAWPLFSLNQGNPGNTSNGSGEGLDQVFTFSGTTRNSRADAQGGNNGNNPNFAPDPNAPGSLLTFEDITRRSGAGSDNDFNDLHFYVSNTNTTPIVIPEPSTYAVGGLLAALLGWHARRRRKLRAAAAL